MRLRRNRRAAGTAPGQTDKREIIAVLSRLAYPLYLLLYLREQLFVDERLVRSFVILTVHRQNTNIELIGEMMLDRVYMPLLPVFLHQSIYILQILSKGGERTLFVEKFRVHFQHDLGSDGVDIYPPGFGIVRIAKRGLERIDAVSEFLPLPAPDVLGKIVHVILGLTKGDGQHKLSLRRVIKPERRKLEVAKLAGVQ